MRIPKGQIKIFFAVIATLIFGALIFKPCSAQSLTIPQYQDRLVELGQQAQLASQNNLVASEKALADAQSIKRIVVRDSRGDLVFVDNRSLFIQVEKAAAVKPQANAEDDWDSIYAQTEELKYAINNQVDGKTPTEVKASVVSVMARSDYASLHVPVPGKSMWDKLGEAISKWFSKIHFGSSKPLPSFYISPIVPEVILIVIATVAVGLMVYFFVQFYVQRPIGVARAQPDSALALSFEEQELVANHNYERLRELASESAYQGDFRSAFRQLFLATLVMLDFEGAIQLDRSKTNWEYLRALSRDPELEDPLKPFVRDFDRIWYGNRPANQGHYNEALARFDGVRQIIQSRISKNQNASVSVTNRRPASATH